MRKAQRGVSSDRALAVQDLGDAIRGDLDPARKFRGAHVQGSQCFGQVLARTNHDGVAAMAGHASRCRSMAPITRSPSPTYRTETGPKRFRYDTASGLPS